MSTPYKKEAVTHDVVASLYCSVVFGFDRVTIWIDRPELPFLLRKLETHCASAEFILGQMLFQARWKGCLKIFQPSSRCLEILAEELGIDIAVLVSYVENALDLPAKNSRHARSQRNQFLESAKMRHQQQLVVIEERREIFYYGRRSDGNKRRSTVLALYADKPSKLNNARPADSDPVCSHQEFRLAREGATAHAGIVSVNDLILFDHPKYWNEKIRFYKLPQNKTELGRLLAKACNSDPNVSGSALRKRSTRWINKHSIFDGHGDVFVMHNALRATPNLEKLLQRISFTEWLGEVMSL